MPALPRICASDALGARLAGRETANSLGVTARQSLCQAEKGFRAMRLRTLMEIVVRLRCYCQGFRPDSLNPGGRISRKLLGSGHHFFRAFMVAPSMIKVEVSADRRSVTRYCYFPIGEWERSQDSTDQHQIVSCFVIQHLSVIEVTPGLRKQTRRMILRQRSTENGQGSIHFLQMGSRLVVAATVPLALGLAGVFYVVTIKLTYLTLIGQVTAMVVFLGICSLCTAAVGTGS